MHRSITGLLSVLAVAWALVFPSTAYAQVSTGTISGRVIDAQGAAVPGVAVEAVSRNTGLTRTDVTDTAGNYRLAALPTDEYDVRATLAGFSPLYRTGVGVSVGTTTTMDVTLTVAQITEQVTVGAATPLISTRSSSVGEVVDLNRIEGLPLNGRQFANLAGMVPGVGVGFHSDVSKSAQYAPQISGGNGRNVTYLVDGGDNNDDTVGGLLQLFPLEAIQEFKVVTQRFDAEYGRSDGALLNVVTKSGTNTRHGSWFTLGRDDALNARTFTEQINNVAKQSYSRYQYGGSLGGPIRRDKVHFFGAYEGTRQNTTQVVNTSGLFPSGDGIFDVPFREHMLTGKVTATPSGTHYLSVRYGRDHNTQPNGAGPATAHSAWATSTNAFDSLNVNHNWITGASSLNEFVFQYSRFTNDIPLDAPGPSIIYNNAIFGGANVSAPQRTEQTKWQFRDDYSWTLGGFGVGHELRTGVNLVHEPRLFISTEQGKYGIYFLGAPDINGPVLQVLQTGGHVSFNLPIDSYGIYAQDDWRATDRLTFNLGVRWDYVHGLPIDQSGSRNFQILQEAGRAGRLSAFPLLSDFGREVRNDRDNIQPRLGVVYDLRGDGRDVLRGGWGVYTDYAYTSSNVILAALDGLGGGGIIYSAASGTGLVKSDGTLFRVTDPLSSIAYLNTVDPNRPVAGEAASPVLQQPYTRQTTVGWEHALGASTAVSIDYARVEGRDLNLRVRPNVLVNGRLALADLGVQPANNTFRVAVSKGESLYNAMIVGVRRRMSRRVDLNASYTLAKATSDVGTAYDEVAQNIIQNVSDPFSATQDAPAGRTDARHRITASAIIDAPLGIHVAPVFFYRSPLPVHTFDLTDANGDGNRNDITALAYKYVGLNADGTARIEEDGPCTVVNCSRRAPYSQLNLRVSRSFPIGGSARIEAIAEVFNLFNARNPFIPITTARTNTRGIVQSAFMKPTAFAGDVGQPEQRVGQIGFRLTF